MTGKALGNWQLALSHRALASSHLLNLNVGEAATGGNSSSLFPVLSSQMPTASGQMPIANCQLLSLPYFPSLPNAQNTSDSTRLSRREVTRGR